MNLEIGPNRTAEYFKFQEPNRTEPLNISEFQEPNRTEPSISTSETVDAPERQIAIAYCSSQPAFSQPVGKPAASRPTFSGRSRADASLSC